MRPRSWNLFQGEIRERERWRNQWCLEASWNFFFWIFFFVFFHLFVLFLLSKTKTIINIQLFGLEIVNWLDLKKKLCVKRMNEKKNYLNNYLRTFDQFVILKMASLYLFYCYIYENDQNKTNDQFYCRHLCCLFSIRSIDSIRFWFQKFFFFLTHEHMVLTYRIRLQT